jgi:hypothetical protein
MKAVRFHEYGDIAVLRYEDAERPRPAPGEVLVRVSATAFNPVDTWFRAGSPLRPPGKRHALPDRRPSHHRTAFSRPPRPGKPAGQRADAGTCTLDSAMHVKSAPGPPRTLSVARPWARPPSVAVRYASVRARLGGRCDARTGTDEEGRSGIQTVRRSGKATVLLSIWLLTCHFRMAGAGRLHGGPGWRSLWRAGRASTGCRH